MTVDTLLAQIERVAREQRVLHAQGADPDVLETSRRELLHLQWELSDVLLERHTSRVAETA